MTSPELSAVVTVEEQTNSRPLPPFLSATTEYELPCVSWQPIAPLKVPVATETTTVSPTATPSAPTVAVMLLFGFTAREFPVTKRTRRARNECCRHIDTAEEADDREWERRSQGRIERRQRTEICTDGVAVAGEVPTRSRRVGDHERSRHLSAPLLGGVRAVVITSASASSDIDGLKNTNSKPLPAGRHALRMSTVPRGRSGRATETPHQGGPSCAICESRSTT